MSDDTSLALLRNAAQMLAEADTIQKVKEFKDIALTAVDFAKHRKMGKDAIQYASSYVLEAERKLGEMLTETERAKGTRGQLTGDVPKGARLVGGDAMIPPTDVPTLADLGLTKRESSEAQMLAELPRETFEEIRTGKKTKADVTREVKRTELKARLESISAREIVMPTGLYDVIVIDPPWPMQKIEREVRPNQVGLDYPTMDEATMNTLVIPAADDCHLWLWTTQKHLPTAFRILDIWGFRYICTFVWHKPGGPQPVGLPQFNCEFALYARRGIPEFIDTKAFPVCFQAPRGAHSEKPQEFYDMVQRVTAGRRLDMFSRRKIDGFDGWGKEAI